MAERNRRSFMKGVDASGLALGFPHVFVRRALAAEQAIGNYPAGVQGKQCTFGFIVPQTGPYSDEGAVLAGGVVRVR